MSDSRSDGFPPPRPAVRLVEEAGATGRQDASPALGQLLMRVPDEVRGSFSPAQLVALESAIVANRAPHVLNFQVSLPMIGGRHYLAVFFDREKRTPDRPRSEGKLKPLTQLVGYGLVVWIIFSLMAATGLVLLYLIKCMLGVDLFPGPSALHGLIFRK